ncbi:MAG TPA: hypothetical protein VFD49_03575 [Candidatus Dormibacteraeota bacterium]|nr:hypothetical protein [Candidatus Dormibacteraeota bacterium]
MGDGAHALIRLSLRLFVTAVAVVLALAALPLYGLATAGSKIDPRLERELGDGAYAYSVRVDLGFRPEYYHIRTLQSIGTVAGVQGDSVRLLQLTPDQVHQVAQLYWVERVEPLDDTG